MEEGNVSPGSVLEREAIRTLLEGDPALVEGFLDMEAQLQPNGFDVTVREVSGFLGPGQLGPTDEERMLSHTQPHPFAPSGYAHLAPGPYLVTLNEVVNLPRSVIALGRPRSSLLRCGVSVGTAVWDAGYRGRSQCLLLVHNPHGFRLARNARILQLVFFRLRGETQEGYQGTYQGENT